MPPRVSRGLLGDTQGDRFAIGESHLDTQWARRPRHGAQTFRLRSAPVLDDVDRAGHVEAGDADRFAAMLGFEWWEALRPVDQAGQEAPFEVLTEAGEQVGRDSRPSAGALIRDIAFRAARSRIRSSSSTATSQATGISVCEGWASSASMSNRSSGGAFGAGVSPFG